MSLKYRLPTRTQLSQKRLRVLLANLRRDIQEHKDEGVKGVLSRAYTTFREFMSKVAEPVFKFEHVRPDDERSRRVYNITRQTIKDDIRVASHEVEQLSRSGQEMFNVASILASELETLSAIASSTAQDLIILHNTDEPDVLVAGDDFNDKVLIDTRIPIDTPRAFVDGKQGAVTLERTSSDNIIQDNAEIDVRPFMPDNGSLLPTPGNLNRFYEGRFYAQAGNAEPEGGKWHLEESPTENTEGYYHWFFNRAKGAKASKYEGPKTGKEGEIVAGSKEEYKPFALDDDGNFVNKIEIVDRGATEEEKKAVRIRMIDGNPDTYWQMEYVFQPSTFSENPNTDLRSYRQAFTSSISSETPIINTSSGYVFDPALVNTGGTDIQEITNEQLRTVAKQLDKYDLEVEITITMPEPKMLNWLSMNPMNFGESAWLSITSLQVAPDRATSFIDIPGFKSGQHSNLLTDDINAEISEGDKAHILSPSRYSYRGIGIWTFPSTMVQVIRFRIRQSVPVPALYQRIHVQVHRLLSDDYKYVYNGSSGSSSVTKINTEEWLRVIKLDYLQTLQVFLGNPVDEMSGETSPDLDVNHSSGSSSSSAAANFMGIPLGGGSPSRSWSSNREITDTGWQVTKYWTQTYYDLLRYSVGIKDIQGYAHSYASSSTIISKEFLSPKELRKVTLEVDHFVPTGTSIDYYVSVNGGDSWHIVNPLNKPSIYMDDGGVVPRILNLNQTGLDELEEKNVFTAEPVRSVRFKAVFKSDNKSVTPVLKRYRLLMYPAEGLRRQDIVV